MKRIMTIIILFMVLTINANAQTHNYKSLAECNNDTVKYLRENFENQKEYFKGKPLSVLLEIFRRDLKVEGVAPKTTSPWIDPNGIAYLRGIALFYIDNYQNIEKFTRFNIYFKEPYEDETYFHETRRNLPDDATDEDSANILKDYIIDDIELID